MLLIDDRLLDAIPYDVLVSGERAETRVRPNSGGGLARTCLTPQRYAGSATNLRSGDKPLIMALTGRMAVTALALLSFYTLFLSVLPKSTAVLPVNFAITPFIIAIFAAVMGPAVLYSGFPRSFFGLQTDNWKSALAFSVLVSLAFIAAAAFLKLILIHMTGTFSSCCLFRAADVRENMQQVRMSSPLYWIAFGLYLGLTPLQEFVVRCCLQAPLQAFLSGTENRRRVWSILVSNLVFAAAHAHISFDFAIAAFIPGLFWGWLFARTNSLIAAATSHFMIGGTGIFLFGINHMVAKFTG